MPLLNKASLACTAQALLGIHSRKRPVKMSSVRAIQAGQTSLLGESALALTEQEEGRGFEIWHVYICILNVTIIFLRFVKAVSILTCWIDELIRKKLWIETIFYSRFYNLERNRSMDLMSKSILIPQLKTRFNLFCWPIILCALFQMKAERKLCGYAGLDMVSLRRFRPSGFLW